MEVVYSILLVFGAFLVGEIIPQQLRRDKRNLIIGGKKILITQAPYQAALFVNGGFICGGSIISARWILTAGHCLPGKAKDNRTVRVGSKLRNAGGVERKVLQAIRHPAYAANESVVALHDIALLLLGEPLDFDGSHISCVTLPEKGEKLAVGSEGHVSGWGRTDLSAPVTDTLRAAYSTILPFKQCQEAYTRYSLKVYEEEQYCIGDVGDDKGSCRGDSGGPFIVDRTIYGVVSWGQNCTDTNFPGVYTDVSTYVQWIRDTVASKSSPEDLKCNA
ncbi:trypsin 3A1-like [Sabethes cyaneus]|uniref:trypsin 3A1-like n=1 Tax=Sabethes cyaneus TaxID=53552 RepID=UPI00237E2C0F|nr:trypsin 3A1-like [Sabethes cyaneus]